MDEGLAARLEAAGQGHLVRALERLDPDGRARLEAEIDSLDLDLVRSLVDELVLGDGGGPKVPQDLEPPDVVELPRTAGERAAERVAAEAGEGHLRAGRVAAVLVAGGQGTRLGFDGPKGAFPFAPITGRILFAHLAAKVAAVRARCGCELPWYVMTSPANDRDTREVFERHGWFGLPPELVVFFVQGTMPAVDRETGAILLEAPDHLALSPDGHGGLLRALARQGLLGQMRDRGIETLFTFQVDNPLVRVAKPELVGRHAEASAEMSNLVVRKRSPEERMGVIARSRGRTVLVEYSDLPRDLADARDASGALVFWAGSVAQHCLERGFVERITTGGAQLPFHRADKVVPYVDDAGRLVQPERPNAVKFESFIFDALPLAERTVSVEADRAVEFSPIKNAEGADSPESARRDLNRLYARWLESAGAEVARDGAGEPAVDIEIDPRYADDPAELSQRLSSGLTVAEPIVLGIDGGTDRGGRTAPA